MNARQMTLIGGCLALFAAAGAHGADNNMLQINIGLARNSFFRGCTDPVKDLDVQITLTNTSREVGLTLPTPKMDMLGALDFEMYLLGAPTGVPRTDATPDRTRILRSPPVQPVGSWEAVPDLTIPPAGSKTFTVSIGRWYDVKAAGQHEMTCTFQSARSNTIQFEVLPVKRVDVPAHFLLGNLSDFERGWPDFPFMFYVTAGPGRFDSILYVVREGKGGYEHFETRWLGQIAPGKMPEVITQGSKIGLMVPDKISDSVSWKYVVDFGVKPESVKGEKISHEGGMPPPLTID